ncbi:hypothetical protein Scep_024464 [Stephania cephalantha]|uniref:Uncharacterized protein n=1 Tax=Stephania cephalantha TaxID=152367 RepID=A0AAP0F5K3_9MAGN
MALQIQVSKVAVDSCFWRSTHIVRPRSSNSHGVGILDDSVEQLSSLWRI